MHKIVLMGVSLCVSLQTWAFPCFVTLVKDSCWIDYNVTVTVMNAQTGKQVASLIAPQSQSWVRQSFTCQPGDSLTFSAIFTPVFWESDKGKVYPGQSNWQLPQEIKKTEAAWNINICYPSEFSEVPLPPEANGSCKCITDNIPPVQPQ